MLSLGQAARLTVYQVTPETPATGNATGDTVHRATPAGGAGATPATPSDPELATRLAVAQAELRGLDDRAEARATALVAVVEGGVRLSPRSGSCEGAEGQFGDDRRPPYSLYAGNAIARLFVKLRNPQWLNAERARAWCRVLAAVTLIVVFAYIITSRDGVDYFGEPVGTDFVSFWTASRLSLMGHPNSAYDPIDLQAAERALFPTVVSGYFAFLYPPTFLLLCLPLALLPYSAALAAWLATGLIALCAGLRRILPQRWAMLPVFVFPGILVNGGHGQNGFVTASCLGWSMVLSSHRPFLAGTFLGLLVIKPHLLLAAPVVLLAARRWTVILGATTSGLGVGVVSWIALGSSAWWGFFNISPLARATLEEFEPWKMQSVFAATRLLHGGLDLAYLLQCGVTIIVWIFLVLIAMHRPGTRAEGALLVVATLLCTPYLLDYDLVCLAIPIAWVTAEAQRTSWRAGEKIVLLAAYILPLVARPLAMTIGVPIAPLVNFALLLVVAQRTGGKLD